MSAFYDHIIYSYINDKDDCLRWSRGFITVYHGHDGMAVLAPLIWGVWRRYKFLFLNVPTAKMDFIPLIV